MRRCAALCILALLVIPFAGAFVTDESQRAAPFVTAPEFNMTGTDITNQTYPSRYEVSQTLIDVKVEVSDTSIPGPKGEMAAGPRTIGFTADPVSLVVLAAAIISGGAGVWYLVRRRPEPEEEDEG